METRKLYKQKYEAPDARVERQARRDEGADREADRTGQARHQTAPRRHACQVRRRKGELNDIAAATDDKWDAVANDVDHAWKDLKATAKGAYDAMTRHKKDLSD